MERIDTEAVEMQTFKRGDDIYNGRERAFDVFKLRGNPNVSTITIHKHPEDEKLLESKLLEDILENENRKGWPGKFQPRITQPVITSLGATSIEQIPEFQFLFEIFWTPSLLYGMSYLIVKL